MIEVNLVSVLVAAALVMAIGFAWYGPLFGKKWMALMGITPPTEVPKGMGKNYAIAYAGAAATAYVMAHFVELLGVSSGTEAAQLAFWAWLGLMVPLQMSKALWESRSWELVGLNAAYDLVMLTTVVSVVALWPF